MQLSSNQDVEIYISFQRLKASQKQGGVRKNYLRQNQESKRTLGSEIISESTDCLERMFCAGIFFYNSTYGELYNHIHIVMKIKSCEGVEGEEEDSSKK